MEQPRILVADDNPRLRSLLRLELEESGASVREAANGAELYELMLWHGPFDAVVADVVAAVEGLLGGR